ncbi:MAG TPA: hypothetical protein VIY27_10130 [Myxococcota bacterium]
MASELFDCAAESLEKRTSLGRLEARGTLRLALKTAGLEPDTLNLEQLRVVFERILPGELETRGVSEAAGVCETLIDEISRSPAVQSARKGSGADEIFRRLGGD